MSFPYLEMELDKLILVITLEGLIFLDESKESKWIWYSGGELPLFSDLNVSQVFNFFLNKSYTYPLLLLEDIGLGLFRMSLVKEIVVMRNVEPEICMECLYKTFMNGKPHSFKGTEGVVGLKRWFEKMEQVFEICKCAEDDKVKFAMCTFEGRALTWWNGNVQTLGLTNANQIPWENVKAIQPTEYCPATEIQRMEQELWTLTLKCRMI
ncbi:hypothetical protein Tco_0856147 [Tanacetum coccineum]